MSVTVRVKGLPELQRKLDAPFLIHPAIDEAVEKIMDRPLRVRKSRQGKGIQNNTLRGQRRDLSGTVTSTTRHPRRTGAAWVRYNYAAVSKMAPNQLRAAARRIEATWAS
jgi:hypothetical protein